MAEASELENYQAIAERHHEAASQHDSAAHHHRQAAFFLSVGEGARARQHGLTALEHQRQAQEAGEATRSWDDYDLDVNFQTLEGVNTPRITSKSLCTPTCPDGTGRSFCCSGFGMLC